MSIETIVSLKYFILKGNREVKPRKYVKKQRKVIKKELINKKTEVYKMGTSIQILKDDGKLGYFVVPKPTIGPYCDRFYKVEFLRPFKSYCKHAVSRTGTKQQDGSNSECNELFGVPWLLSNNTVLSTFHVLMQPSKNESTIQTVVASFKCFDVTNYTVITCPVTSTIKAGSSPSPVCTNAYKLIHYKFTYEPNGTIVGLDVEAIIGDVPNVVVQQFIVTFVQPNSEKNLPQSGNPGYIIGRPILAAKSDQTNVAILKRPTLSYNVDYTAVNMIPNTIIRRSHVTGEVEQNTNGVWTILSGGYCELFPGTLSTLLATVNFGEDTFTGCLLRRLWYLLF